MPNNYFQFKQFTIKQDKCAMKVGTDGVLLGAWADTANVKNILDIGTGTGLIAIMLAQKSEAGIDAVEIDGNSYTQALENAKCCKWNERLNVFHVDFQLFYKETNKQYDLIVSNPPYFTNSQKAPVKERTMARHNDSLPFQDLLTGVAGLLSSKGRFCVILPFADAETFIICADKRQLHLNKQLIVKSKPEKQPNRILLEFSRKQKPVFESTISIEQDIRHSYSDNYKELTKAFYLAF